MESKIDNNQLIISSTISKSIDESFKRLENFEMKPDLFKYLVENYVNEIKFTKGKTYGFLCLGNRIEIGEKSNSLEEITKTLIHESIHLGKGIFPSVYKEESEKIEKRIEAVTNESFKKYKKEYLTLVENLVEPVSAWDRSHWQDPPEIKNYSIKNEE